MSHSPSLTILVVGLWMGTVPAAAQPSSEASNAPERAAQIAQWIADLDSDRFVVRNAATRGLLEAGEAALPQLTAAFDPGSAESSWRAIQILTVHCRYGTPSLSAAALDALEAIAASSHTAAALRAKRALEEHRTFRHEQAVAALRARGAYVKVQGNEAPEVRLDHRWEGEDGDLACLRQLQGLRMVSVSNSSAGDAALEHIAAAKEIERLFLGDSRIRGPGLRHLPALGQLTYLSLKGLPLEDDAVAPLGAMTQLTQLGLDDTPVGDAALERLHGLTSLQTLWLNRTRITDEGLRRLRSLTALNKLYLSGTQLHGRGLAYLPALPNLRYLSLQHVPLTDEGLVHVRGLVQLDALGLDDTRITTAGIPHLRPLANLQQLWLTNADVGDEAIPHLKELTNLSRLEVRGCRFSSEGLAELRLALPECQITP